MSELRQSIIASLEDFAWGNYGLDGVEILVAEDREAQDWIKDLAWKIEQDWVEYVDSLT